MTKKTNPSDPLNEQIDRIRSEFREMPGLRLTFEQMLRLWMLDRRTGRVLLKRLLDARFLEATPDGQFVRCDFRESIAQRRRQASGLTVGGRTFLKSHRNASD
jgi:hypothetical protein